MFKISKTLKVVLLIEILLPIGLLTLGIYHGLMQVLFRSGAIKASTAGGFDYYQGLTLHGVINALVLTTFFTVAFGHICMAYFLKKEPNKKLAVISMVLMVIGTLLAALPMLLGKASVLYTFYPPLKAHPAFYIGATLLVVGSWIPMLNWPSMYMAWRKKNPDKKIPIAVLGTLVNFTIWLLCTLAVAYEIIVLILPWALGWKETINVPLSRTLFWFFGHALVYFWLLPAYIAFYVILPKISGGKLFSENAGRLAFFLFLIFSIPVGAHHQFSEPGITRSTKFLQTVLTFGVAIPSFITAFTIAASLEYSSWRKGSRGWLKWIFKLPYFKKDNPLFGYLICGLILFFIGGTTGLINASYSLNSLVHNTAWIPGHFHTTVAGPVFLGIVGMGLYFAAQIMGKEIKAKKLATAVPYIWTIGIMLMSTGLMVGGLMGEPRRTNLGITYTNPDSPLFRSEWVWTTHLAMVGGIVMTIAFVCYMISLWGTVFSPTKHESHIEVPTYEALHEEPTLGWLNNFKPWLIAMLIVVLFAYVPALIDVFKYYGSGAPPYIPQSPVPVP